jgi:hypothetical protein
VVLAAEAACGPMRAERLREEEEPEAAKTGGASAGVALAATMASLALSHQASSLVTDCTTSVTDSC